LHAVSPRAREPPPTCQRTPDVHWRRPRLTHWRTGRNVGPRTSRTDPGHLRFAGYDLSMISTPSGMAALSITIS
jgi:hypothetical protein